MEVNNLCLKVSLVSYFYMLFFFTSFHGFHCPIDNHEQGKGYCLILIYRPSWIHKMDEGYGPPTIVCYARWSTIG